MYGSIPDTGPVIVVTFDLRVVLRRAVVFARSFLEVVFRRPFLAAVFFRVGAFFFFFFAAEVVFLATLAFFFTPLAFFFPLVAVFFRAGLALAADFFLVVRFFTDRFLAGVFFLPVLRALVFFLEGTKCLRDSIKITAQLYRRQPVCTGVKNSLARREINAIKTAS